MSKAGHYVTMQDIYKALGVPSGNTLKIRLSRYSHLNMIPSCNKANICTSEDCDICSMGGEIQITLTLDDTNIKKEK